MNNLDKRVQRRAQKLWEEAGRPLGGSGAFVDQATELLAIEDNPHEGRRPLYESERAKPEEDATLPAEEVGPGGEPVEPIEALENAGEFPTLTDQGEEQVPHRERRGS